MSPELEARIAELEKKLAAKPGSRPLLEQLLQAFCSEQDAPRDVRRLPLVIEYIERFPHTSFARCPLAQYDPEAPHDALAAVEAAWQSHADDHPRDPLIVRGLVP